MWWRRARYLLALVGLCAIATCPAAKRSCTAKRQAQEAEDLLGVLVDHIAMRVAATGKVPPTPAGPTPVPGCCAQGGECDKNLETWAAAGWPELEFTIDGSYRYTYQYIPDANGLSATLRATGDLDCDGESSLYEVKLKVAKSPLSPTPILERAWTRKDPYE